MPPKTIKKKHFATLTILLACPFAVSAQVLPVQQKYIEDGKKNWSWAASAQSVLKYFGTNKSQVEIGDYGTNGYDVPNFLHGNGDLNRHGVDEILLNFGGIESHGYDSPMSPEKVFIRINHFGTPVFVRWAKDYGDSSNTGPDDRIIVIKGAKYREQALYLMLMDPVDGTYERDYKWVIKGDGHVWAETLEIVTRPPSASVVNAEENGLRSPNKILQSLIDIKTTRIDWNGKHSPL